MDIMARFRVSWRRGIFVVTIIYAAILVDYVTGESCERKSTCSCECSGGTIDLKALESKSGPKYVDQPDLTGSGYLYSYNPCKSFTETNPVVYEDHCYDVAACQVISQGGTFSFYDTGTQDSVTFYTASGDDVGVPDEDEVVVAKYAAKDDARETEVVLVCNTDDDSTGFAVVGELALAKPTYRFVLVSPECCFFSVGISPGSIMLIIFFSLIFVYVVGMVSYNKFVAKSSGADLIPHRSFWVELPALIKDGVLFVFRRSGTSSERKPIAMG